MTTRLLVLLLGLFFASVPVGASNQGKQTNIVDKSNSLRHLVPDRWWEKASAIARVSIRPRKGREGRPDRPGFPLDPTKAAEEFEKLKAQGYSAVDFGQPTAVAGRVYAGLATYDYYSLPSDVGTVEDFKRLVRIAHSKGLATTIFMNIGYCALEAPFFLKACDDVHEGKYNTKEARWFLWSDSEDAPPPAGDNIFMITSPLTVWSYGHRPDEAGPRPRWLGLKMAKPGIWEYSERAGKYYWSKWGGGDGYTNFNDDTGKRVQMPHMNFGNREWQEEAEKILRFWMDTGLDGTSQDAPNWYIDCGWDMTRRRITEVISSYGNAFMQAEGAGVFYEDPSVWITEGGYNCVRDYSLYLSDWVGKKGAIVLAMETGDPRYIEKALRDYHDRVVEVGGVLWSGVPRFEEPKKQHLSMATVALSGNLVSVGRWGGQELEPKVQWLLKTKQAHPALQQLSRRRKLPTSADDKHYAFLRTATDGSERILVVLNYQPTGQTVEVDLSGVATAGLVDLESGSESPRQIPFRVEVPPYGYRLYQIKPGVRNEAAP